MLALILFFSIFFGLPTTPEPIIPEVEQNIVRCAGIMCNDNDFFFYNYNFYTYMPLIEGGN